MEWQPIETAPLDGTQIIATWIDVFGEPCVGLARYGSCFVIENHERTGKTRIGWMCEGGSETWSVPTHWMPLPPPPTA